MGKGGGERRGCVRAWMLVDEERRGDGMGKGR